MTRQKPRVGAGDEVSGRRGSSRVVRAFVHIRGREIPYSRAGWGAPVVLLADAGWAELLWAGLTDAFTVFAPVLGDGPERIADAAMLRELVDCIGLTRPHLVAAGAHAWTGLRLASSDADSLDRIALVWHDPARCAGEDAVIEEQLLRSGRRVPLICASAAEAEARYDGQVLDALRRFLGAEPA